MKNFIRNSGLNPKLYKTIAAGNLKLSTDNYVVKLDITMFYKHTFYSMSVHESITNHRDKL